MPSVPPVSVLTAILAFVLVYFCWMDVATYMNLQRVPLLPARHLNESSNMANFSPFEPLTVKQLMQSPINHYVEEAFGHWTVAFTPVALWFSANTVSFAGVVVAALAARLMASDSLRARQLGVFFFKIRDYLDSLDGWVARARSGQNIVKVNAGHSGYYVDGICDGIGALFVFIGKMSIIEQ